MAHAIDWTAARSLEQRIFKLFEKNATGSQEFKTYVAVYGEEKIATIWEKYQALLKERGKMNHFNQAKKAE